MKLKIFSEKRYLTKGVIHEPILYPFWGEPQETPDYPAGSSWSSSFNQYSKIGDSFLAISSLEEADIVVLPTNLEQVFTNHEAQNLLNELLKRAKQAGKISVGFFYGDCSHLEIPIQCDLVFRNSLYSSTRKPSDFAYPAWSVDFTEKYFNGHLPIRQKRSKPIVGFCGFLGENNFNFYAKHFLYQIHKFLGQGVFPLQYRFPLIPPQYRLQLLHFQGHLVRRRAVSALSKSPLIQTNFVFRNQMGLFSQSDPSSREAFRQVYVTNMQESDYILCCRGYGNYSFRFYETLSCGRIPIFIDTDCVLPYDFEIDWKQYCVWLTESEIPLIGEKIAEFHEKLSPKEFIDLQHECWRIWQERLSPEGFFANLYKHLPFTKIREKVIDS